MMCPLFIWMMDVLEFASYKHEVGLSELLRPMITSSSAMPFDLNIKCIDSPLISCAGWCTRSLLRDWSITWSLLLAWKRAMIHYFPIDSKLHHIQSKITIFESSCHSVQNRSYNGIGSGRESITAVTGHSIAMLVTITFFFQLEPLCSNPVNMGILLLQL